MPLVSLPCSITENLKVYAMTDVSPRTDISTDVDTDEKNQRVICLSYSTEVLSFTSFFIYMIQIITLYVGYRILFRL